MLLPLPPGGFSEIVAEVGLPSGPECSTDVFYGALLQFLTHMRAQGFLTSEHYSMLTVGTEVEPLLDEILTARHVRLPKPIEQVQPEVLNTDAK